jgi:hypothetical protein
VNAGSLGKSDMRDKIQDIAVIGGLVVFFLRTYALLPLATYHA